MIDWPHVAFHALWIVGCALILATLSYANWLSQAYTRQLLSTPVFQLPLSIGLVLISCSLFLLSQGWLEHVLWAILTVTCAWQAWSLWRSGP